MTQRAVKSLQAFEFRSDFALPAEPEPPQREQMDLSAPELARLLSQARAEERMQAVTLKLNEALADLVTLARHIETGAYEGLDVARSLNLINATAQRIIDGQGDLFAAR